MKPGNSLSGLASIIIPGCKPLELIRPCITALRRYTRRPWELIVIDDGSSDDTSAYLESVRDAVSVPVTVITNVTSRGIAAAINQGLKAARGEYLVLLNNDVVVTDGWLGQLIALANAKGDFTAGRAECAETKTEGGREGRPADDLGAVGCSPFFGPPHKGDYPWHLNTNMHLSLRSLMSPPSVAGSAELFRRCVAQ